MEHGYLYNLGKLILTWISVLGAVFTVLGIIFSVVVWPLIREPIQEAVNGDLSVEVSKLSTSIEHLTLRLDTPKVLHLYGFAVPVEERVKQGSNIDLLYFMNRVVSCETDILVQFYSVDRRSVLGSYSYTIPAVKSPTSDVPNLIPIVVNIPSNLPVGRYMYLPIAKPIDCGVYKDQPLNPSSIFEVY